MNSASIDPLVQPISGYWLLFPSLTYRGLTDKDEIEGFHVLRVRAETTKALTFDRAFAVVLYIIS